MVHTDGWRAHAGLAAAGYQHQVLVLSGGSDPAHEVMPRVHRAASLLKRWLIRTHQGGVQHRHLDYHLDDSTSASIAADQRPAGCSFIASPSKPPPLDPPPTTPSPNQQIPATRFRPSGPDWPSSARGLDPGARARCSGSRGKPHLLPGDGRRTPRPAPESVIDGGRPFITEKPRDLGRSRRDRLRRFRSCARLNRLGGRGGLHIFRRATPHGAARNRILNSICCADGGLPLKVLERLP